MWNTSTSSPTTLALDASNPPFDLGTKTSYSPLPFPRRLGHTPSCLPPSSPRRMLNFVPRNALRDVVLNAPDAKPNVVSKFPAPLVSSEA